MFQSDLERKGKIKMVSLNFSEIAKLFLNLNAASSDSLTISASSVSFYYFHSRGILEEIYRANF